MIQDNELLVKSCEKLRNSDDIRHTLTTKTDIENFTSLYSSFGIDCIVFKNEGSDDQLIQLIQPRYDNEENDTCSDKFGGYHGFCTVITFSSEGAFIKQEFFE